MKSFLGMFAAVGALALVLAGCPKPLPPPNPPAPDAADAAALLPTCEGVCDRGRALGCSWARPTASGATCEIVCSNANDPSGPIRWDLSCRVRIATCDDAARCQ